MTVWMLGLCLMLLLLGGISLDLWRAFSERRALASAADAAAIAGASALDE
ncbi:MAG: pilus assembly protein TadG-related protein, partial [Acidimicrobiia bacterium]